MAELVREEVNISEEDVGNAEELLGDLREAAEQVDPTPTSEADTEVGEMDWNPLENPKIRGKLNQLSRALVKLKNIEGYRNEGKSDYVAFRAGKNKGVACIYLTKKSARVSVGKAERTNGRMKGSFPKERIYKCTEAGYTQDGESVTQKEIVAQVKDYAKARDWV